MPATTEPAARGPLDGAGRLVVAAGFLGVCLLVGVGLVGHVLAVAGMFSPWPAIGVGLPLGAFVWFVAIRSGLLGVFPTGDRVGTASVLAVVLVVVWTVFAAWAPSQHVVLDRDPSSYLSTGIWLGATRRIASMTCRIACDSPMIPSKP